MKWKVLPLLMLFAFFSGFVKLSAQVNTQDSLALVDLYNSTDGPHWINHYNWLTEAPVNSWFGVTLKNDSVYSLLLASNNLTGSMPSSLGNLTLLNTLWQNDNKLIDTIPHNNSTLKNLTDLELSNNQLSGSIPSSIGDLSNLIYLDFISNQLTGYIPASLGNLQKLQRLSLYNNKLSGNIPSELGSLINLQSLDLSRNELSGNIPSSLGNLANLGSLYLFHNQLTGNIPSSLGDLTKLTDLELDNNQLNGSIPSSLGNLHNLSNLELNGNHLSGNIPATLTGFSILPRFFLYNNQFTFGAMEAIATAYDKKTIYAPQANIPLNRTGNQLAVSAGGTLTNNTYKWYKDAVLVSTKTGDSTFVITSPGKYNVAVTNAVATDLTLYSDTLSALTLPLTLLSFTGAPQKNAVSLQWQTVNEINTHQFAVEHSGDGLAFTSIGTIAAVNNPGNHNYTYTDANPYTGSNYYRLKMMDKDGYFNYSRIIQVKMGDLNATISIYPNPVKSTANLLFTTTSAGKYTVNLTDLSGKLLKQLSGVATIGLNKVELNIQRYASGTYLVVLTDEKGNSRTLRLVK